VRGVKCGLPLCAQTVELRLDARGTRVRARRLVLGGAQYFRRLCALGASFVESAEQLRGERVV